VLPDVDESDLDGSFWSLRVLARTFAMPMTELQLLCSEVDEALLPTLDPIPVDEPETEPP